MIARRGRRPGYTVLEILIAITVFSLLFIMVMDMFSKASRDFNLTSWRTAAKQRLSQKLALLRLDFDKANYPCAVFPGGTVIYDGASVPATADDVDRDPGVNYYVRYLEGKASGDTAGNTKLLEWRIRKPDYMPGTETFLSQETKDKAAQNAKEIRCTLSLQTDAATGAPELIYERAGNATERHVVASGVQEVDIQGKAVKPAGYEQYETVTYKSGEKKYSPWDDSGVINLTIKLNSKYLHGNKYGYADPVKGAGGNADMAIIEERVSLRSTVRIQSY